MLSGKATNINFSLWFDPIGTRTHDLPHSRRARLTTTPHEIQHHRKTKSCANSQSQLSCFLQQNFLKSDFAGRNGPLDYRIIATVPFIKMRETLCLLRDSLLSPNICVHIESYALFLSSGGSHLGFRIFGGARSKDNSSQVCC